MKPRELAAVAEFQKRGDTELSPPGTPIERVPANALTLNHKINVEEIKETRDKGVLKQNLVELADGCADTIYTLAHAVNQLGREPNVELDEAANVLLSDALSRIDYALSRQVRNNKDVDRNLSIAEIIIRGIAATYELPLDALFDEVHRSNMTKVFPDGKVHKNEYGKVIKPEGYSPARIEAVLKKHGK